MTEEAKSTIILDDSPASVDTLDFEPYALTLADLITSEKARTPLTIGVFGPWGSGKTSLLHMIHKHVKDKVYRTVWFNAWKYARDEIALWRALVIRTLDALRPRDPKNPELPFKGDPESLSKDDKELLKELDHLEESIYHTVEWKELGDWNLDWPKALLGTVEGAADIALSFVPGASGFVELFKKLREATGAERPKVVEAFKREVSEYRREQLRSVEQFVDGFEKVVSTHVKGKGKLVLFIDDLDRCLPEQTIEVLEAIKLFLDVPECVFLLAVDQRTIQEGIKRRYKDLPESIDGLAYLEKIVQLPFQLPPIAPGDMKQFVGSLVAEWEDERCSEVFVRGLGENPRQVKRTINVFLLLWQLAQRRAEKLEGKIKAVRLAKVVVIQHVYPRLFSLLRENPGWLAEIEQYAYTTMEKPVDEKQGASYPLPPGLEEFASRTRLRMLLTMHGEEDQDTNFTGLKPDELRLYFTLTRWAEAPEIASARPAFIEGFFEIQTVLVPAGSFLMGSGDDDPDASSNEKPQHKVKLSEYSIGKYPVTNLEYQAFVQATGHRHPRFWEEGRYPEGQGDHPVVGVSWDDANEYCQWLEEATGKPYRLPTEAEWEKAARGPEGYIYPWGNEWDKNRCNTNESGIGRTTSVRQYSPEGDSSYGVADMTGNVWEWCSDWYDEDAYIKRSGEEVENPTGPDSGDSRVLRGGSWFNLQGSARCAFRFRFYPDLGGYLIGFRVVVSPSVSEL